MSLLILADIRKETSLFHLKTGKHAQWSCDLPKGAVVQLLSPVWLFAIPWSEACQTSLSFTISRSLLKLMSIELVMPFRHLIPCHPLLLLPSVFPSIRVFSNMGNIQYSPAVFWSSLEPFASGRTREAAQGPGMKQMVPSWGGGDGREFNKGTVHKCRHVWGSHSRMGNISGLVTARNLPHSPPTKTQSTYTLQEDWRRGTQQSSGFSAEEHSYHQPWAGLWGSWRNEEPDPSLLPPSGGPTGFLTSPQTVNLTSTSGPLHLLFPPPRTFLLR